MSGFPRVLILMATRNGARFLPEQLDSIACQEMTDWALHVGDDGSDDCTRRIVADFAARYPSRQIRLHEGPQRGAAANFLSLLARPDLPLGPDTHVAFADQDDIWLPEKLARALMLLKAAGPGPAIHGAQSLHVDAGGCAIGRSRPPAGEVKLAHALVRNPVSGHSLVLDPAATLLARSAGVPAVPFHDWWLAILVLACGGRVVIDDAIVLHYRQHEGNVLGGNRGIRAALRRLMLVLRGDWGRWIAANLDALRDCCRPGGAPVLSPEARAMLDALAAAPPRGRGRVEALARLGLRRQSPLQDALLAVAAWRGRL